MYIYIIINYYSNNVCYFLFSNFFYLKYKICEIIFHNGSFIYKTMGGKNIVVWKQISYVTLFIYTIFIFFI